MHAFYSFIQSFILNPFTPDLLNNFYIFYYFKFINYLDENINCLNFLNFLAVSLIKNFHLKDFFIKVMQSNFVFEN